MREAEKVERLRPPFAEPVTPFGSVFAEHERAPGGRYLGGLDASPNVASARRMGSRPQGALHERPPWARIRKLYALKESSSVSVSEIVCRDLDRAGMVRRLG
jgi:hypothetical protein